MKLRVPSLAGTLAAARALGALLEAGDCIELVGGLGAGKTTFTKGLCAARGVPADLVVSPSFTIVCSYVDRQGIEILHADGFRLQGAAELDLLGLEEAAQAIFVIEWPEMLLPVLPTDRLRIELNTPAGEPEARELEVSASGERSRELLESWSATWSPGSAGPAD